jgi:hypothetical protein
MRKFFSRFLDIDYDITGEYYDSDGSGRYTKKYNRRYKFRVRGGKRWHYLPTL